ncbi:hypothetical protein AB0N14_13665 [Streptomyces sp. NPDC051104]|uniref:hypothetical protein n=1 Tax=Streptomyces sp. NPDC051104 TaxID=3155044 RepID=UPI00341BD012
MPTPADELRAAAEKLRAIATHPDVTPGPWLCLDGGDRIIHDGPGIEFGPADYVVDEPVSNSANAELIAAMHPGVGAALADWLTATADFCDFNVTTPTHVVRALALARRINAA